jgi:hypothetical protein
VRVAIAWKVRGRRECAADEMRAWVHESLCQPGIRTVCVYNPWSPMFPYIEAGLILVALYVALKISEIAKRQSELEDSLRAAMEEIKASQKTLIKPLAYGWYDDGWPFISTKEEANAPLEQPKQASDDYLTATYLSEYATLTEPRDRREYLRHLLRNDVWMREPFLDVVFADSSPFVRAWAAAHLRTVINDYSGGIEHPVLIRDYEPALLADQDVLVRASVWTNPKCERLPWGMIWVADDWKEHFRGLPQLDRLGLMRNPGLSKKYVVGLLETPTEDLGLTRQQHVAVLRAAASNANLIWSSRAHGRDYWMASGDVNTPFDEFGQMWNLSLNKWRDDLAGIFLAYVQTTPKVKMKAYTDLLSEGQETTKWWRRAVIASCDPIVDRDVLKAAWNDPDEDVRQVAHERVGRFAKFVGVTTTGKSR